MLNSKSVGNKIAEARKKMNLSQADLAQQISISPQAVGKWERGESMPDITTLNRLAEIFGLDLNYFSDSFLSTNTEKATTVQPIDRQTAESSSPKQRKNFDWNWDMSKGNWVDADFSGLKNLKEKFSSSNIKNCNFLDSDLSGLILKSNYIDICDFSNSDLRNSKIQKSFLTKCIFTECSLIDSEFSKSFLSGCDFTNADFTGVTIYSGGIEKSTIDNALWNSTSFVDTYLGELVFSGTLEDCSFENCGFSKVKFQNATILNTFFKNNRKFKKVEFDYCKVDKITYAFLKNNQANLTGITVLE